MSVYPANFKNMPLKGGIFAGDLDSIRQKSQLFHVRLGLPSTHPFALYARHAPRARVWVAGWLGKGEGDSHPPIVIITRRRTLIYLHPRTTRVEIIPRFSLNFLQQPRTLGPPQTRDQERAISPKVKYVSPTGHITTGCPS